MPFLSLGAVYDFTAGNGTVNDGLLFCASSIGNWAIMEFNSPLPNIVTGIWSLEGIGNSLVGQMYTDQILNQIGMGNFSGEGYTVGYSLTLMSTGGQSMQPVQLNITDSQYGKYGTLSNFSIIVGRNQSLLGSSYVPTQPIVINVNNETMTVALPSKLVADGNATFFCAPYYTSSSAPTNIFLSPMTAAVAVTSGVAQSKTVAFQGGTIQATIPVCGKMPTDQSNYHMMVVVVFSYNDAPSAAFISLPISVTMGSVSPPSPSPHKWGAGDVAGIVIGVLLLVGGVAVGAFVMIRRRRRLGFSAVEGAGL
jgi:hypothetical protein